MSEKKHISTTALSKKLSITKPELDKALLDQNLIQLTDKGIEAGGIIKKHPTHGEYIAWPQDIQLSHEVLKSSELYSSTQIGEKYNISARKINMILSEIGFTQKYLKGWNITKLGQKYGGVQKENHKSGVPFVVWPQSLFENSTFKAAIEEVEGKAGETTQNKIDKSERVILEKSLKLNIELLMGIWCEARQRCLLIIGFIWLRLFMHMKEGYLLKRKCIVIFIFLQVKYILNIGGLKMTQNMQSVKKRKKQFIKSII